MSFDVQSIFDKYQQTFKRALDTPTVLVKSIEQEVNVDVEMSKLLVLTEKLNSIKQEVKEASFKIDTDSIQDALEMPLLEEKDRLINEEIEEISRLEAAVENAKAELEASENNQKAESKRNIEQANAIYLETAKLKEDLAEYNDYINNICFRHKISLNREINDTDLTIEDLKKKYEEGIKFITGTKLIIDTSAYNKLPDQTKEYVVGCVALLSVTPFLPLAMIAYGAIIMAMRISIKNNIEKLADIYSLLSINPKEFGYVELSEDELIEVSYEDERLQPYMQKLEEFMGASEIRDQIAQVETDLSKIIYVDLTEIIELESKYQMEQTQLLAKIDKLIDSLDSKIIEVRNNTQLLHESLETENFRLNTNFLMGYDKKQMLSRYTDIGSKSIILKYSSIKARDQILPLLFVNFMGKVKPRHIRFSAFDEIGNNLSLVSLYSEDANEAGVTSYNSATFDKDSLKDINDKYMRTARKLGTSVTIGEFNEECMTSGLTPIKYGLSFVLTNSCAFDKVFLTTLETSASYGEYIVMAYEESDDDDIRDEDDLLNLVDPSKVLVLDADELVQEIDAIILTEQDQSTFRKLLDTGIEKSKSKGLHWSLFIDNYFRKKLNISDWKSNVDNLWKDDCLRGVSVLPGYKEGDPNEMISYDVGSDTGNPHALWAGASGAGKSVFINQVVNTWAVNYSPEHLEFIFTDFKGGTELSVYAGLPHTTAVVSSEDVSYALSLFKYLQTEQNYRNTLLNSISATFKPKSMVDFNKWFMSASEQEKNEAHEYAKKNFKDYKGKLEYMKRIVAIIDEFQVPFTEAQGEQKVKLKQLFTNLAKVARSVGIIIILCSQSMDGTLDADVLSQFTSRVCLRVKEASTSKSIIGHDLASTITDKFGLCYAGDSARQSYEQTYLFKTPFLNVEDIEENIALTIKKANKIGYKITPAISYNQKTIEWLSTNEKQMKSLIANGKNISNFTFYGRLMEFTKNSLPYNLKQTYGGTIAMASDTENYIDIFRMLKLNQDVTGGKVMIHSVDKEMSYLLHLDELNLPNQKVVDYDYDKFATVLEGINEKRTVQSEPLTLYLIGYDSLNGIGINPDRLKVNKFVSLVNSLKGKNVDVIILVSISSLFPNSIIEIMGTKIATLLNEEASRLMFKSTVAAKPVAGLETGFIFISSTSKPNYIATCKIPMTDKTRQAEERTLFVS